MPAIWMGPVGLAIALVGAACILWGYRTNAASLSTLPEPLLRAVAERLAPLERAAIVVAVAVAIYLGARQLGHGRVGLYACVAILVVNAAVVATLRIRWFGAFGVEPAVAARHRRASLVQMAGSWIAFTGCAIYLLRP